LFDLLKTNKNNIAGFIKLEKKVFDGDIFPLYYFCVERKRPGFIKLGKNKDYE